MSPLALGDATGPPGGISRQGRRTSGRSGPLVVVVLALGALRAERDRGAIVVKVGTPASRTRLAPPAALRALQCEFDVGRVWHGQDATRRRCLVTCTAMAGAWPGRDCRSDPLDFVEVPFVRNTLELSGAVI